MFLDGVNTKLTVRGNLGTNTNLILTACPISQPCTDATTSVVLDAGSFANRYDAYKAWGGVPLDRQMSSPVQDPGYPFPTSPDPNDARWNFSSEPAARMTSADCTTQVGKIPSAYRVDAAGIDTGAVICYRPGAYNFRLTSPAHVTTMVFSPGVYFLNGGFQVGNNVKVIGGYDPGQSGVAFVFPRTCNPACTFAGNSADLIALNAGSAYPSGSGTYATAASNWNGVLVQTTGRNPLPMTLLVRPDAGCVVGPADAPACQHDEGQNRQLRLPGSGSIFVIGVQYAPTDNVAITGGSGSNGYLGQVWAWTVQYTGGSNIYLSER